MDNLLLTRMLVDGALYGAVLSLVIMLSLRWNPRLWIQDFPQVIRDVVPPLSAPEKRDRALFGVIFMALVLGLPLLFAANLASQLAGGLDFAQAYLYLFGVLMIYNIFDAVVVDWLFIIVLRPDFLRLPGTEHVEYALYDPWFHISAFLKGIIFCAVGAAILALVVVVLL